MNPQQELIKKIEALYLRCNTDDLNEVIGGVQKLIEELEAKDAHKDQLIETLRLDAEVLCNDLDDVRMAYCSLLASYSVTLGVKQDAQAIAKSFGWSCYDRGYQ